MIHTLRHACLLLFVTALLAGAVQAGASRDEESEPDWVAIQAVISAQLEAFKRDDGAAAFSFAAPSIQKQFGTPAEFMHMVRTGYAPVYRPASVRFLSHYLVSGQPVQPLEITTPDDAVVVAFYIMERQPDGSWRIAGCALGQSGAVSA
jgi:Domain of unknown function (DUF4864)